MNIEYSSFIRPFSLHLPWAVGGDAGDGIGMGVGVTGSARCRDGSSASVLSWKYYRWYFTVAVVTESAVDNIMVVTDIVQGVEYYYCCKQKKKK